MSKLEIAKRIVKENWKDADCGIFDCRNVVFDPMNTLYSSDGLSIDICYRYSYFEVFGLTSDEFDKLKVYYEKLRKREGE